MENVQSRRNKISEKAPLLLASLKKGRSIRDSCDIANVTRQSVRNWLAKAEELEAPDEYIQFYFDYHEARGMGLAKLLSDLDKMDNRTETQIEQTIADAEIVKGKVIGGKVIKQRTITKTIKQRESSFNRAMAKLRSGYPERWGQNPLPDDDIIDLPDAVQAEALDWWRNPDLYAFRSDNCVSITTYQGTELIVVGPTRCGKTIRILDFLFGLMFQYPRLQILVCRSKEVDLRDTIKVNIRNDLVKYDFDDPLSPIKVIGGRNFTHLEINGGTMTFGGMDRPGKILGTKYDIVFYSQIEQSTQEEFQKLKTRCSGDARNWIDEETGEVRYLLIGDANAAQDNHYLLARKAEGLTDFIRFGFHDNPLFFRNGQRTEAGHTVIGELDKSLTGVFHDRLFKSIWTSVAGAVFPEFDKAIHIQRLLERPVGGRWVMALDFGFPSPSCVLLIHFDPATDMLTIWREIYKTRLTLDDLITEMENLLFQENIIISDVEAVICDHDSEHIERLNREGFPAIHADKPIITGLELIRSRLINRKLIISEFLNRTPDPNIDEGPRGLIDEFGVYRYKPREQHNGNSKDDIPVDENNHSIDPLRYTCKYFDESEEIPIIGGQISLS